MTLLLACLLYHNHLLFHSFLFQSHRNSDWAPSCPYKEYIFQTPLQLYFLLCDQVLPIKCSESFQNSFQNTSLRENKHSTHLHPSYWLEHICDANNSILDQENKGYTLGLLEQKFGRTLGPRGLNHQNPQLTLNCLPLFSSRWERVLSFMDKSTLD